MNYQDIKNPNLLKIKKQFELKQAKNDVQANMTNFAEILIQQYQNKKDSV